MEKLLRLLQWLDNNLIKILIFGFILIIPLYPKFPITTVNYTYIAIRAEDLYIGLLTVIFLIQLLRKKITLTTKFLPLFIMFWGAVFLSYLYGAFVDNTIPFKQVGFLHAARRVEYMMIFFIAASTMRNSKDLFNYLRIIFIVMLLVCAYGIGQKFAGWPAVQTMNPEFARGHLLYLTPEARVSSTFAGHYDLAAYLVLLLPILLAYHFTRKKITFFLMFVVGVFVLMLTASRVSFIAYIVSVFAFIIFMKKPKYFIIVLIISGLLTYASQNLTSRIFKTFQVKQIFVNEKTGQVVVPQKITSKELPAGTYYIPIDQKNGPVASSSADQEFLKQKALEDARKKASESGKILTATEEAQIIATAQADLKTVNTVVSDISFSTRLQVEWPRAINAFLKNPILGTGPSSITEATDNDYLRWIGEFGALGTGLFLWLLFSVVNFIWQHVRHWKGDERIIYYGFIFGMGGLMINAAYIDVFEASKVAYHFWLVSGIFVGSLLSEKVHTNGEAKHIKSKTSNKA